MDPEELEIEYPCRWEYTLVGRDEASVRAAVERVLAEHAFTLTPSKRSAAGSYVSFKLEVVVHDDAARRAHWQGLAAAPEVLYLI